MAKWVEIKQDKIDLNDPFLKVLRIGAGGAINISNLFVGKKVRVYVLVEKKLMQTEILIKSAGMHGQAFLSRKFKNLPAYLDTRGIFDIGELKARQKAGTPLKRDELEVVVKSFVLGI